MAFTIRTMIKEDRHAVSELIYLSILLFSRVVHLFAIFSLTSMKPLIPNAALWPSIPARTASLVPVFIIPELIMFRWEL